ncbi:MAG: DUF2794 domain-containing protein [Pseudomonadota bacterium]
MTVHSLMPSGDAQPVVAFDRRELQSIHNVYGQMVAAGEWRDYAIDMLRDRAVFSIFRRAAEQPIYRVEKRPRDAGKQGAFSVVGMDGRILKRGHDLRLVLRVLERKLIRAVEPD